MLGEHNEALEQARPLPCLTSTRRGRALATPLSAQAEAAVALLSKGSPQLPDGASRNVRDATAGLPSQEPQAIGGRTADAEQEKQACARENQREAGSVSTCEAPSLVGAACRRPSQLLRVLRAPGAVLLRSAGVTSEEIELGHAIISTAVEAVNSNSTFCRLQATSHRRRRVVRSGLPPPLTPQSNRC